MTTMQANLFPFKLDDLKAWVVHRNDGTVTRFQLVQGQTHQQNTTGSTGSSSTSTGMYGRTTSSFADYCTHKPGHIPVAEFVSEDGVMRRFWVASMGGAKATKDQFDFVVDCGDIFNSWQINSNMLEGDKELCAALNPYLNVPSTSRVLKVDWDDRAAPKVKPQFWTELNKLLHGDTMTCCVGGHGRSGTSFVCLLLNNAADYDALDAVIHLRAVHCPRAIESVAQHEYINSVAEYLGRAGNAKLAHQITDYKAAFLASTKPTAVATRKYLLWGEFAKPETTH